MHYTKIIKQVFCRLPSFFEFFRLLLRIFYNKLNFNKNIKIFEKNMFKIAKKNLILVKIDALYKNNPMSVVVYHLFLSFSDFY